MYNRLQTFEDLGDESAFLWGARQTGKDFTISYWRTASQLEIDFILGEHEIAIEVKATNNVTFRHLKGAEIFCGRI